MKTIQGRLSASHYVVIQVVLLCALTIPFISRPYWDDELFSIRTTASLDVLLDTCRRYENNMVAYYGVLMGWIRLFGNSEPATRSLSLLFAVFSIVAYWPLARRFFSPVVAAISGLFLALNPLFIYYAVEARGYSMLLLLALLSMHLFLQLLTGASRRVALLYVLVTALSVYTHYFGLLLLPVQGCFALLSGIPFGKWVKLSVLWILVIASVLPLWIFKPASLDQVLWMAAPTWKELIYGVASLFGGAWFLLAFGVLALVALIMGRFIPEKQAMKAAFLGFIWTCIPVGIVFLYSIAVQPLFQQRYFIWVLPGTAILIGFIVQYAMRVSAWLAGTAMIIVFAQVLPAKRMIEKKGTGYRDATAFIVENAKPGDVVVAYPFFKGDHYSYFLSRQAPGAANLKPLPFNSAEYLPGGGGRDPDPDSTRLDAIAAKAQRVFVICNAGPREADARQNRIALPAIERQLGRHFSAQQSHVFGAGFEVPTRVIVFSR